MKNILCYGDSNTWGYTPGTAVRYAPDVRWTGVAQQLLGAEYHIIEEGLNARTTVYDDPWSFWRNGKEYLPACLISHKPLDLLVISLGTNDLKFTDAYGATKGVEALISLTDMVQNKKESSLVFPHGVKVLVISPITLGERVIDRIDSSVQYKYEESCKFGPLMARMAKAKGAAFIDAAKIAQPSETDCVHMNPDGHKALGIAVAEEIRKII